MTSSRRGVASAVGATMATLALVAAYRAGRAHADDIPAAPSMYYGVTLENGGAPLNESRLLQVRFFGAATGGSITCDSGPRTVLLSNGHGRVPLGAECVAAVHASSEQWAEVSVDGTAVGGRSRLGAVPYAVEAQRAAGLTTAAAQALVPPGTVVAFAGDTAPAGWRLCNGDALSQTEFPALFRAIGTAHGNGGASGMFNLPDLRGRFVRGVSRGTSNDADRATREIPNPGGNSGDRVGSLQRSATAMPGARFTTASAGTHAHGGMTASVSGNRSTNPARDYLAATGTNRGFSYSFSSGADNLFMDHVHAINPDGAHVHDIAGGDSETRPVNVGLNYIIRL